LGCESWKADVQFEAYVFLIAIPLQLLLSLFSCFSHIFSAGLELHENGVSSVQYDPNNVFSVLTTGFDATIKLMDVRNGVAVQIFERNDISLKHRWAMGSFSQRGRYIASGSTMTEQLFVWDSVDGSLQKHLSAGNDSGIVSIDWSREHDNPNKLATLDRKGKLIIWS
jgi:WD40 repeat protein